jgi:hypothetical protein
MATSGTVGQTSLDTAKVIEHALRRCRVKPALQTPEIISTAKESLYMLLVGPMATQGLNLWCVETNYIGLATGQAAYDCPVGTIDVLNVVYSQATRVTGTDSTTATSITTELAAADTVRRVGIKLSATSAANTLLLESSTDGVTWTVLQTHAKTDWATDTWYWFNLDPVISDVFFRASMLTAASFSEFYLATTIYDLPVTAWNRDTFSVINAKTQQGRPSTSYYLERLLTPRVTLWPVPNNDYDHLTLYRHRQIQDIGTLTDTIEIPQRWFDPLVWKLASVLCFELDMVDPALIANIAQMAEKVLAEVENDETDGAPLYIAPAIRAYTT